MVDLYGDSYGIAVTLSFLFFRFQKQRLTWDRIWDSLGKKLSQTAEKLELGANWQVFSEVLNSETGKAEPLRVPP